MLSIGTQIGLKGAASVLFRVCKNTESGAPQKEDCHYAEQVVYHLSVISATTELSDRCNCRKTATHDACSDVTIPVLDPAPELDFGHVLYVIIPTQF